MVEKPDEMTREFKTSFKAIAMTRALKYNYEAKDDDFFKVKIKKTKIIFAQAF